MSRVLQTLKGRSATVVGLLGELRAIPANHAKHRARPPEQGLVLDVGGGDRPNARADVVLERYVEDSSERGGSVSVTKPLVIGDAEAIPFDDLAFAYVITSHVIEHATDPARFAAELTRIAPAGFVQVPTRLAENTFGWPFHRWFVDLAADGTLHFWELDDQRAPNGGAFHQAAGQSALLRLWMAAHESDWLHSVHWQRDLPIEVHDAPRPPTASAAVDLEKTLAALRSMGGALLPLPAAVQRALRCPSCHGRITLGPTSATCAGCNGSYPTVGPTPVLLAEARS